MTLVRDLQQHAGDLAVAIPYNSVVQHLLTPSLSLSLQDTLHAPEYVVFLARLYEQAIFFRNSGASTETDKTVSLACGRLVKHVATLLHYLAHHVTDATTQVLNTNYFVRGNNTEDSEMQESESYAETLLHNGGENESGVYERKKLKEECSVRLQLLCLYRAAVSVVGIYQSYSSSINIGAVTTVVALPNPTAVDAQILQLVKHSLPDHTAHVRAAQCLTVSALSLLFDTSTSTSTTSTSQSAPALPIALNTLLTTTTLLLQDGYSPRIPGCKIAAIGLCDFVKYASILRPKVLFHYVVM